MSSIVGSDTVVAEKAGAGSAKQGLGSRATSKVTFREGDGKQKPHSSAHPTEGERHSPSSGAGLQFQHQQLGDLKKKDDINPFKFSPDVDFCALSQLDKREKAQERERMQNLKVHDKLSKAQRLMKGRRFRVLKEIDEEVENERSQNKENRVASMRDNAPWLVAITRNRRVENESL
ncbi:unnamed protein product, partial [Rotaria magnacalcarata]